MKYISIYIKGVIMFDIVIIGAGIVGCSIARKLARYHGKIALLEKNIEVGMETTKANSAIVHAGYDCKVGSLKAKLNVQGNAMFPALSKELGFAFRNIGSLVLAFGAEEDVLVQELYERGIKNGVPKLSILTGEQARKIEPKLSEEVTSALYAKTAGVVDPFNFCFAMAENAVQNGVELFTQTEVQSLAQKEDYFVIYTNQGEFKSRFVINAAGLYSANISRLTGENDYDIVPTMGVYRLLSKNPKDMIETVLFQVPTEKGKGVLVTSTYAGNTMVGPTTEKISKDFGTSTQADSLAQIDDLAKKSVPSLNYKATIRIFSGVRAKPTTGEFMIYPSKTMQGFIHVGGIESPGLTSAPAIAEYVAELLQAQGFALQAKPDFVPSRKPIAKKWSFDIHVQDSTEEYICLCERITETEIVDAIYRPAGARTIEGIKRRVRAGMGPCQGKRCRPKVAQILARELNINVEDIPKDISGEEIVARFK